MAQNTNFNQAIINAVLNTKGCKDAYIVTLTDTRMPKKTFGDKVYKLSSKLVCLGGKYEVRCENRSVSGEYDTEKPFGKHWVAFPYLLASDKDESKLYLRTYPSNLGTAPKNVYFIGSRLATAEETAVIVDWYNSRNYDCQKQLNAGISSENQVVCRDYSVDNILAISANGAKICRAEYIDNRYVQEQIELAR